MKLNKTLLYDLFRVRSKSYRCEEMQAFLSNYLEARNIDHDFDNHGNIYAVKGVSDTYPCVVAHIDTVHDINKNGIEVLEMSFDKDLVMGWDSTDMKPTGIGGDDKCGIYAALHCLEHLPAVKIAFFVDEEVGCRGSAEADMDFFKDCRFILQADRRGHSDFVTDISGPLSSHEFQQAVKPIIERHGYSFTHGMMTDVMQLRDNNVGISVANMSAAYYLPHQANEYVSLSRLLNVTIMMQTICQQCLDVYPCAMQKRSYRYYSGNHNYGQYSDGWYDGDDDASYMEWWNKKNASSSKNEEEDDGIKYFDENGKVVTFEQWKQNRDKKKAQSEAETPMEEREISIQKEKEKELEAQFFPGPVPAHLLTEHRTVF